MQKQKSSNRTSAPSPELLCMSRSGGNCLGLPWWTPRSLCMVEELEKGVGLENLLYDLAFSILYWSPWSQTPGFVEGSIWQSKSRAFHSCLGHFLKPKIGGAMDCQMKQFDKSGGHICHYLPVFLLTGIQVSLFLRPQNSYQGLGYIQASSNLLT